MPEISSTEKYKMFNLIKCLSKTNVSVQYSMYPFVSRICQMIRLINYLNFGIYNDEFMLI